MWSTFEVVIAQYREYFASGGFGLLFFICLFYLALVQKRTENTRSMLMPSLILLAVLFCPVSASVIGKMIDGFVYWRVFWLLPIVAVVAYVGVDLCGQRRKKGKQIAIAAVCIGMIALNGSFLFTGDNFEARENNYKLPTEVIWVADAINQHAAETGIKGKKMVAPAYIATYIRIYDASIHQRYGRDVVLSGKHSELYEVINADAPDYERLAERCRVYKARYVVLKREADDQKKMETLQFEKIYESPSYAVYFNLDYQKKKK